MSRNIDKVLFINSRIVETIAGFVDDLGISMAGPGVLITWSNFGLLANHLEFYMPVLKDFKKEMVDVVDVLKSKVIEDVQIVSDLKELDDVALRSLVGMSDFVSAEDQVVSWDKVLPRYREKHIWEPDNLSDTLYLIYGVDSIRYVITLSKYERPVHTVAELSVKNNLRSMQAVRIQISGRKYTEVKPIEKLDQVRLFLTVSPNEVLRYLMDDIKDRVGRDSASVCSHDICMWIEIWMRYSAYLKDIEALEDDFMKFICNSGAVTLTDKVFREVEELPNAFSADKDIHECITNMPCAEQCVPHLCPQESTSFFDSEYDD